MKLKLFLILLAVGLCACQHQYQSPTDAERAASFDSMGDPKIQGDPAREFLLARTAMIFSGHSLAAVRVSISTIRLTFADPSAGQPHDHFQLEAGHAAAIDARGYFLTAGHVVTSSTLVLVYYDHDVPRLAIPRVVARNGDIALLQIPAHLADTFTLSDADPAPRSTVLSLGFSDVHSFTKSIHFVTSTVLAGTILPTHATTSSSSEIVARQPTRHGDSGSALVSSTGQLLGIVCDAYNPSGNLTHSISFRPDPQWLRSSIDSDQSASPNDPQLSDLPNVPPQPDLPQLIISPTPIPAGDIGPDISAPPLEPTTGPSR